MNEVLPVLLWHLVVIFFIGGGVGYFAGVNTARARASLELVQTYQHLLEYGRPTKPVATVTDPPPDAETRATVQISEMAHSNLAEHISKEAGVSMDRAKEEAATLLSHFETTGQAPS